MNRLYKTASFIGTVGLLLSLSACSGMALVSTSSGIREFYRGQNGLVVTGKAKANQDDSYHGLQRKFETESTTRSVGALSDSMAIAESWGNSNGGAK